MKLIVTGSLSIEVIQLCNLHCDHCMRGDSTNKRITKEVAEKIFDNIIYADTIVFTGGEITLAYNEIKMIIDIIKEKNIKIKSYYIMVNGTNYNKKLFDLLNESFDDGQIYISTDYFHDKSILEIYKDNIYKVIKSYIQIMAEYKYCGFSTLPHRIFNCGRAVNLDNVSKIKTNSIGFFNMQQSESNLFVGPRICFDTDGNLTNGDCTYEITPDNHFGNIFTDNLSNLIINNSISTYMKDEFEQYFEAMKNRLNDYYNNPNADNYVIKDKKLILEPREIVTKYTDEIIADNRHRLIYKCMGSLDKLKNK